MQSRLFIRILLTFLLIPLPVLAEGESLRAIRQLSNEIYRLSHEMIAHGSEGHAHEIVSYGQEMIRRTETLIKEVESSPSPKLKEKKKPILASLIETLNQAKRGGAAWRRREDRSRPRCLPESLFPSQAVPPAAPSIEVADGPSRRKRYKNVGQADRCFFRRRDRQTALNRAKNQLIPPQPSLQPL
ncbi:MAG: hypothetical protein MPW15_09905 [Candidatus Manganitrophus sp.]|nr:hypothetical protein [Candidatus Manganitrophus sp.]